VKSSAPFSFEKVWILKEKPCKVASKELLYFCEKNGHS
jgi:hypothetical protein